MNAISIQWMLIRICTVKTLKSPRVMLRKLAVVMRVSFPFFSPSAL